MPLQVIIVLMLTFIIYIIGTLAYSVRVVGVKTGRIAIAFAIFNVFALISRTANSIQAPLLAKTIENNLKSGQSQNMLLIFRMILMSTTFAVMVGAILMPTFIKLFTKAVQSFSTYKSVPKLVIHGFSKGGVEQFKNSLTKPKRVNINQLKNIRRMPKRIFLLNIIATSISTVGILASLYAGYLSPELRSTCNNLSSVVNMFATLLLFIFIDPFISMLTDDVVRGECSELYFNRAIIFIVLGLFIGTILSQLLLVPAAHLIINVARLI